MVQDLFISFFHLYLGLDKIQLFDLYFTPALWYFIVFAVIDFKLLNVIREVRQISLASLDVIQNLTIGEPED